MRSTAEIEEALVAEIEKFLAGISHQSLVDQSSVVDFCLDLRSIAGGSSNGRTDPEEEV